jgi:hypothetical protein
MMPRNHYTNTRSNEVITLDDLWITFRVYRNPSSLRWVRLNKCTENAIGYDDSEIGRFLCSSSSKKGIDIKTIFLAEKVGCRCFH